MTVSYDRFVTVYPEFADMTLYPEATVSEWLQMAFDIFSPSQARFGVKFEMAQMLFAAHNLSLGARNMKSALSGGGAVGMVTGPTGSKSVGPVSVSYNLNSMFYKNAGLWNGSTYGLALYQIFRISSAAGLYVPGHGRFGPFVPPTLR